MSELFKLTKLRYFTPEGRRCSHSHPQAIKKTEVLPPWYADIRPIESAEQRIARKKSGLPAPKRKRVKLCINKPAAKEMLRDLIQQSEREAAGIKDYMTMGHQELGPIVDEFETHLRKSGERRTEGYIETTIARIKKVFHGCKFLRIADFDCTRIEDWLFELRNNQPSGATTSIKGNAKTYKEIAERFGVSVTTVTYWRRKGAPITPRTKNNLPAIAKWHAEFTRPKAVGSTTNDHYVTALKRFGNWLVRPGRKCETNPFADLDKLNDDTELRKQRRVLDPDQFSDLITAAAESQREFRGINGADRASIYTLAAYTGLRAGEIGSLQASSFDFGASPTVTVEGAYTKNGDLAVIPLRSDLASILEQHIKDTHFHIFSINKAPSKLWPGRWNVSGANMIRIDLEVAGIPYSINGKDYDFHALRHQFITNMARAGVSLRSAQELARHSKPELTANIYTHLSLKDTTSDVEKLDAVPTGKRRQYKGTGEAS